MQPIRKTDYVVALAGIFVAIILAACSRQTFQPPVAKKVPHQTIIHGDTLVDNYYWLRERDNPEVIAYLEAENAYTDSVMAPITPFWNKLYEETVGHIKETDLSVPAPVDSFFYYSRTEEGRQYPIYCRKLKSLDAPEEIILDLNVLAENRAYFNLGGYYASPDHRLLAYTVDTTGYEQFNLYIKDLTTGRPMEETIPGLAPNVVWANDNKTVFYITLDDIHRPAKLYRHILGHPVKNDVLVYEESDRAYDVRIIKSSSRQYLFVKLEAIGSTEYMYLKADNPTASFKVVAPRRSGIEYDVFHHGDNFYLLTNDEAINFKVISTPIKNLSAPVWTSVVPPTDTIYTYDALMFRDFLVLMQRVNGTKRVVVRDIASGREHQVVFPESIFNVYLDENENFATDRVRLKYESMVTPSTIYDYDVKARRLELLKQKEVLGGYDKANYVTERVYAAAGDGARIPISLVYKTSLVKDGSAPALLYGYGAYGISSNPSFSYMRLPLLDRGIVYAVAHVRGGSEMGRQWYDQGKLAAKINTFTDFIACAEYLVREKFTSSDKLVISGGSAGGLLIGAVVNMRPDLFYVAIAEAPFVDAINTMLDPSIPLTVNEYTEWGNPQEAEAYGWIRKYSPYDNVTAQTYPHLFITGGLNDPNVHYWEPAKWAAKLRATKTGDRLLLLKMNMGAGHGGASGRYDYIREEAFINAFVLDLLGIKE